MILEIKVLRLRDLLNGISLMVVFFLFTFWDFVIVIIYFYRGSLVIASYKFFVESLQATQFEAMEVIWSEDLEDA